MQAARLSIIEKYAGTANAHTSVNPARPTAAETMSMVEDLLAVTVFSKKPATFRSSTTRTLALLVSTTTAPLRGSVVGAEKVLSEDLYEKK
jgi:hypothetical protein